LPLSAIADRLSLFYCHTPFFFASAAAGQRQTPEFDAILFSLPPEERHCLPIRPPLYHFPPLCRRRHMRLCQRRAIDAERAC